MCIYLPLFCCDFGVDFCNKYGCLHILGFSILKKSKLVITREKRLNVTNKPFFFFFLAVVTSKKNELEKKVLFQIVKKNICIIKKNYI